MIHNLMRSPLEFPICQTDLIGWYYINFTHTHRIGITKSKNTRPLRTDAVIYFFLDLERTILVREDEDRV